MNVRPMSPNIEASNLKRENNNYIVGTGVQLKRIWKEVSMRICIYTHGTTCAFLFGCAADPSLVNSDNGGASGLEGI